MNFIAFHDMHIKLHYVKNTTITAAATTVAISPGCSYAQKRT